MSDTEFRQEVARLRAELNAADVWANGIQLMLVQILPHLLRNHPNVVKVQQSLQFSDARYEELLTHPERAEEGESAGQYEAGKMLYRQLAILGVWPNISPTEAVDRSLARAGWQPGE